MLVSHHGNLRYPQDLDQCQCNLQHWRRLQLSPPSQSDSSTESNSESSSCNSACSTMSSTSYTLRPRLPITYKEAALSQLYGRPQVRTLNFMSSPFPSSDDESEASDTPAEIKAYSPYSNPNETLTSQGQTHLMTRG